MSDHWILVDGYNLILRHPELRPGPERTLRDSRDKLLNLLSWAFGNGDARFVVVFDGTELAGGTDKGGRVEVRYSKPPEKADDVIRRMVEEHMEREDRVTVVTADLEVARHARAMGANVSLADLFLASVMPAVEGQAPEKPASLSKREVEEWAEIFRRGGKREDEAPN